jgi:hypothetical protein
MTIASNIFSFPGLTVAATAQFLLAIKLLPRYYESETHLALLGVIFSVNYAIGVLYWALLYPMLFSPLRHIPGPKVSDYCLVFARRNGQIYLLVSFSLL